MPDEAPQATTEAIPATTPSVDTPVTDAQTYSALIQRRVAEARKDEPGKGRDDKGRFQPRLVEPEKPAEPAEEPTTEKPAEEVAAETEPEKPAESEKSNKIEELRKKVEAERTRRRGEFETKRRLEEYSKVEPLIKSLNQNKVGTVDQMLSEEEFGRLCDARIARLNGTETQQTQAVSAVEQRVAAKLAELEALQLTQAANAGKLEFSRIVDHISAKHPDIQTARDYLEDRGFDYVATCVKYAEDTLRSTGHLPPPEQARDEVINFVLQELDLTRKLESKRAAPTSEKTETPDPKKKKTLNSTLKGAPSRPPEIRVTGSESYAELIKAKLRAAK
jgi:hypothetical protein